MKELIIKFEPFVFKQKVFIRDTQTGLITQECTPQKELASYISLLSDIDTIHFFGNEKYANKIKKECIAQYKLNNVNILINQ